MAYFRGHKPAPPEVRAKLHADALKRHDHRISRLPKATAPAFDCRTAPGYVVLPVDDQGSCGDCFMISALDGCSMAMARAGVLPGTEAGRLSGQYGLDCQGQLGGCNGGDEAQVIDMVKTQGWVLTSAYGPYTASGANCKSISGMATYKISDWGYCTPAQQGGIADTQDMKNCIAQYGPISVAFDASECDSYQMGQTMTGNGQNVDHAVLCIGWDDNHDNGDGTKGAFLGLNQWGNWGGTTTAGDGTFWIKYGADSWGTEAIFIMAGSTPPPPPPPPGPGPGPGPTGNVVVLPVRTLYAHIFGIPVPVTDPGGTFPVVPQSSAHAGVSAIVIPAWLLPVLQALCTNPALATHPVLAMIASVLCPLLPPPATMATAAGATLTLTPFELAVLRFACSFANLVPAPYNQFVIALCSLLPPQTSAFNPCGCK
jgi:hypothetical protein